MRPVDNVWPSSIQDLGKIKRKMYVIRKENTLKRKYLSSWKNFFDTSFIMRREYFKIFEKNDALLRNSWTREIL